MYTRTSPRRPFACRPQHSRARYFESLESRTLLSSTLFVTSPLTPQDATHFQTLQSALAVALPGDTIVLQSGFSLGNFNQTALSAPAVAGSNTLRTLAPLEVGQVVTVGTNSSTDLAERVLVTAVSATGAGDFLVTLASPLAFSHVGSLVDATNATSIGMTIAIDKALTLTADSGVVLPFNIALWKNTSGATLSNLNLTSTPSSSLFLESGASGNTLLNIHAANQVFLDNASNNTLTNITAGGRLFIDAGSSGNLVTGSTLKQLTLRPGSHHNTFTFSTIGGLNAVGGTLSGSGYDTFKNNAFTGQVKVTGNLAAPTGDSFLNNTFKVDTGDALTLLRADGTTLAGNIVTASRDFARGIVIGDSANVTLTGNDVTITGAMGIAVHAYADLATTSLDITANTLVTVDGYALFLNKYEPNAVLEARVQDNDFRHNAIGVFVSGDGESAGNIDLGGGLTSFGSSLGNNDFRTVTVADSSHFAIGLANTSADYTLLAKSNKFALADPMLLVADATHNLAAGGTGTILATAAVPSAPRELLVNAPDQSIIKDATFTDPIATFTDNLSGTTAESYLVTIQWSDGLTATATVSQNPDGSFNINAARTFSDTGLVTATITIATTDNTFSTTLTQEWSVTTRNGKVPPGKKK